VSAGLGGFFGFLVGVLEVVSVFVLSCRYVLWRGVVGC